MLDAAAILNWYDRNARALPWRVGPAERARGIRPDPYRVWLSEAMLQQTTVSTVIGYFGRFTGSWPTLDALAASSLEAVLVQWAGLGYYARARNLHACARAVAASGGFPARAAELRRLPGIGPYTAAAIAAICFDEPVAVIDTNVERVLSRWLGLAGPPRESLEAIRAAVQDAVPARAGDFAQALMDIGATVCAPRQALCTACPLRAACRAAASGNPLAYPVPSVRPVRPTRYGHAYVMRDEAGDIYLRRRPPGGPLARMTEVPGSDWAGRAEPAFPARAPWRRAGRVVHVFTHFRLELEVWTANIASDASFAEGWWASPLALHREALPSLYRKVLAVALG